VYQPVKRDRLTITATRNHANKLARVLVLVVVMLALVLVALPQPVELFAHAWLTVTRVAIP
jgi:hypothetical protein